MIEMSYTRWMQWWCSL